MSNISEFEPYLPENIENILEKHIDLGEKDLLKETNNLCAHYGIKFIPYLASIWAGKDVYLKNKNWAQIKKNGNITQWDEEFNSVAMCFNSEYINYFFKIVDEIVELYDIDGLYFDELSFQSWCKCENCNTLFRKEYGIDIPSNTDDKIIFNRFLDW